MLRLMQTSFWILFTVTSFSGCDVREEKAVEQKVEQTEERSNDEARPTIPGY